MTTLKQFQQSELKRFDEEVSTNGLNYANQKDFLNSSIEKAFALGKEEKENKTERKDKVWISVYDAHYLKGHLETLIKFLTTVHNEEEWNIFLSKQFSNYNNLYPAKKMLFDLKKSIKKTEKLSSKFT